MWRLYQERLSAQGTPITFQEFTAGHRYSLQDFSQTQSERMLKYQRQWHEEYSTKFLLKVGVLCLCKNGLSPAMWAHYTHQHKGLLIEFDETHDFFQTHKRAGQRLEVGYQKTRSVWDYEKEMGDEALRIKSSEWIYEDEVRFVRLLETAGAHADPNGKPTLVPLPPASVVGVTVGMRATEKTIEAIERALNHDDFRHVMRCRAVPNLDSFQVDRVSGLRTPPRPRLRSEVGPENS
jgi:hypothetical protein